MVITLPEIVKVGTKDREYTTLIKAIKDEFPDSIDECIPLLHPFFKIKMHFSVIFQDGLELIVYHDSDLRSRMVIPQTLRNKVKHMLHSDHRRDLIRVKQRVQQHVYWPNMMSDLKAFIEQCEYCQINMPSHPKEPLIPSEAPTYPFQQVAADYFNVSNHSYFLYVDRYLG